MICAGTVTAKHTPCALEVSRSLRVAGDRTEDTGIAMVNYGQSNESRERYVRMCREGRVQTQAARHPRTQRWLFSIVTRLFCYVSKKLVGEATDRAGEIESATTAVTALPL